MMRFISYVVTVDKSTVREGYENYSTIQKFVRAIKRVTSECKTLTVCVVLHK
ncbi:MAG: hypothetical protein ACJA2E_002446 [Arenicella sp.]|jgi:hypothetical protein